MARPMPPVSPCAPWLCSGTSTPTGLARAATIRLVARRSTTSMASSITPTGSTICSSPPQWEGENYEPRNPMESGVFNLILWVLYTGMQWKCLPVPKDANGTPAIHYTTVYKVFATWADDGSLWHAFVASVAHLSAEKHLDLSVLHGDGTNTVAKKGGMGLDIRDTNTRRATRLLPSSIIMALSERLSLWLRSMRPTWCWCRKA